MAGGWLRSWSCRAPWPMARARRRRSRRYRLWLSEWLLNVWSTAKLALSSDMSTRLRKPRRRQAVTFVVCVENSGYPASLERHKIYRVLPDQDAAREGDLRIVDESGEDYLYPAEWFAAVEVPRRVRASLLGRPARLQSA